MPLISENPWLTLAVLPFVAAATGCAYYFAGIILTVSLTRAPFPVGWTYGIDLIGAAVGCLGSLALMSTIDTPSGLILLAALAAVAGLLYDSGDSEESRKLKRNASRFAVIVTAVALINASLAEPVLYPIWSKTAFAPRDDFDFEAWNSISRITVEKEKVDETPFLWGPSLRLPSDLRARHSFLRIDNDAGTPITRVQGTDLSAHAYLAYDITNMAYCLPNLKKAAVIGVGGGRDVLSAKYFGVSEVTGIDVNPVQIHLLRDHDTYSEYAGLKHLPGVRLVNSEARSWFRQNEEPFDVVEMSLIDTWAATGAGAFALSENGLYTREAWSIFFRDLSPQGVFTVSRWAVEGYMDDTARLLSLGVATLLNEGIENTSEHICLVLSDSVANLMISKNKLSDAQISAIEKQAEEMGFIIIASPRVRPQFGIIGELINAKSVDELNKIAEQEVFDVSPSTDMRPFFFNQARFSDPLLIAKLALVGGPSTVYGQAKATFNLFLIIAFSVVMVASVILFPIIKKMAKANFSTTFVVAGSAYFFQIGIGFMLLEVSLLQAFGVYLGHPIYGLSVVLFSLILSTGVGSLLSEKYPLKSASSQTAWVLLIFVYAALLAVALDDLFSSFAEVALLRRAGISVTVLFPLGILLGYGFPTGIRLASRRHSQSTAWFWGINGASGVLGSALAIALNIATGIDTTLLVAGFIYLLLALPLSKLARS